MGQIRIFLDADVLVSAVLSSKGAAYWLVKKVDDLERWSSNLVKQEVEVVLERLGKNKDEAKWLWSKLNVIGLESRRSELLNNFDKFVRDGNDAHVIAGANKVGVRFLVSFNQKDFEWERIRNKLGIITITPGMLLQYLRFLGMV